ncbi:hypothetical protein [Dongia deserti]|uniref:hypothetical protein n=1 Tax=Dongia deserti TaxID=2268030 RepID=UPI0013C43E14|nr:hypothetical protein [Dongia deserti]
MRHKSRDEIRSIANILPSALNPRPMPKRERLERWADALDRERGRLLKTLFRVEYVLRARRMALRADDSPLSIAYKNPFLRAEGLTGDAVGDAMAFFGITERELHDILCFCHYGEAMRASEAAERVRAVAAHA